MTVVGQGKQTVDETGKATLTNKKYSVLSMGQNDGAYNEFYAEYTLNLSDIAIGKRNWYSTCFNIGTRASYSTGFTGDVLHDLRDSKEAFYARLQ